MRIGIFGGTFNPVHFGHLAAAAQVHEALGLEWIYFVPCMLPPHKSGENLAPPEARLRMLALAIEGDERFKICDVEIRRGGVSYSIDTIAELKQEHPEDELHFIIGADMFLEFESWRQPERIVELAKLVVVTRPGIDMAKAPKQFLEKAEVIEIHALNISSSMIRELVKEGKTISYLVPKPVEEYIIQNGLYR